MTEMRGRCAGLGEWRLAGDVHHAIDRRTVFGAAVAASAAILLAGKPAAAFTQQTLPAAVLGAIPERPGVLPWRTLALAETGYGREPVFPDAVRSLDGCEVVVEGHMMALDDSPQLRRFLLTAYRAHCPFCMPGGAVSMIAISADAAIPVSDKRLTLRGTLQIAAEPGSLFVYRLTQARAA